MLVADVFTEQSDLRGGSNMGGAEVGFRHQITQRVVLDSGLGTEFAGPSDRAEFIFTAGFSWGF